MSKIISFEERPWGTFQVLSATKENVGGKKADIVIKKIVVNPEKRLSLQSHTSRTENWYFVSGYGEATVADNKISVKAGESITIPMNTKHRISNNATKTPLVFIETSTGDFDEADIIRYEDDYGRVS